MTLKEILTPPVMFFIFAFGFTLIAAIILYVCADDVEAHPNYTGLLANWLRNPWVKRTLKAITFLAVGLLGLLVVGDLIFLCVMAYLYATPKQQTEFWVIVFLIVFALSLIVFMVYVVPVLGKWLITGPQPEPEPVDEDAELEKILKEYDNQ